MDFGLLALRSCCTLMLMVGGILAFSSFEQIAPAEFIIRNGVTGGLDAFTTWTANLIKWQESLRAGTVVFAAAGIAGVWLCRRFGWILSVALPCLIVLLLVPPLVKRTIDRANVSIWVTF